MMAAEPADQRLRRLRMRSARRGTKEMDLILGPFAQARLGQMSPDVLSDYEALLEENDQDLYAWITGRSTPPERHGTLVESVRQFHAVC